MIRGQGSKHGNLDATAALDSGAVLRHGQRCLKIGGGDDRLATEPGGLPGLTEHTAPALMSLTHADTGGPPKGSVGLRKHAARWRRDSTRPGPTRLGEMP